MGKTKIEWTEMVVNAVNGCSVVSPGCTNCYAMRLAGTRMKTHPTREGLTIDTKAGPVWNGTIRVNEKAMLEPLRWRRPRNLFWNAHGDLFHPAVPDAVIDRCFAVMALTPQHIHQVLTKRGDRMRAYLSDPLVSGRVQSVVDHWEAEDNCPFKGCAPWVIDPWPLDNVWLGVSVEDQTRADERIPDLLATPAAVRFLSCEPLLGPVDLTELPSSYHGEERPLLRLDALRGEHHCGPARYDDDDIGRINWVICGGESGPKARPMHPDWARSLRDQCAAAGVPFFFKQWGEWVPLRDYAGSGYWPTNKGGCIRLTVGGEIADAGYPMQRLGKKAAGRLLDGVEHNGMPA